MSKAGVRPGTDGTGIATMRPMKNVKVWIAAAGCGLALAAALGGCAAGGAKAADGAAASANAEVGAPVKPQLRYKVVEDQADFFHLGPQQPGGADEHLKKDTRITLVKRYGGYSQVEAHGTTGYVASDQIAQISAQESAAEDAATLAQQAPPNAVAANDVVLGSSPNAMQNPVALRHLLYAFGTLGLIVAIQRLFHGFMGTVAVLVGLVAGTLVAWLLGDAQFGAVADAPWVGATTPFWFGVPTFSITAVLSMLLVMVITMVETTGDVYATGEIVRKRIDPEDIARAIRADGVATVIGGVLNSFPYTCFAENVGLVRLTQVKSRWVVAAAAVIMVVLGSLPKAAAIVAGIPLPVLGGAALAMFAAVAVVGVQTLARVDFNSHSNIVIVGTSIGLGMLVTAQPFVADAFPAWMHIIVGSGITLGASSAIILNLVFNHLGGGSEAVAGRPSDHLVTLADVNAMDRVRFDTTFGGLVENTPWVLERAYAMRPFVDTRALRTAFHEVLLTGTPAQQMQLMSSFPDLGHEDCAGDVYRSDHARAGLGGLAQDDRSEVQALAAAYRKHFGFPLIICAREVERYGRVLANGWYRMANAPRSSVPRR